MNYAEASYFEGYAFQHIAAWQERARLKRIADDAAKYVLSPWRFL